MKVKIDKLIFGGQGLGRVDGKVAFVWNALPDEEVEVFVTEEKKKFIEGKARTIIKPSPHRIKPREEHFLSCAPWQILSYPEELKWKIEIARETFERIGKLTSGIDLQIISSEDRQYNYRNKMEWSFTSDGNSRISLAFFERGTNNHIPVPSCELAHPAINSAAKKVVRWLNEAGIPLEILKSMIMRCNERGEVLSSLLVTEAPPLTNCPKLDDELVGFHIHLYHKEGAYSRQGRSLFSFGKNYLEQEVSGLKLKHGPFGFFQINVPIFEAALQDIFPFIDPAGSVIDYYAGVGAISLPLSGRFKDCILVDSDFESHTFARKNIENNKCLNCKAQLSSSEDMIELIEPDRTIILDPPRAGLGQKMVGEILERGPKRLIYLSCNISSQARDIEMLSGGYTAKFMRLYNFFPRTPHIECLCVLDRI